GHLYISMEYATAVHLCACGCKSKVVTPLGVADWQLIFDGTVTLRPSIGNGQFPCRSHYFIRSDRIEWMHPVSAADSLLASSKDQAALRTKASKIIESPWWWGKFLRGPRGS
ncbi:MAG TPA: hypothetical protein DEH05_00755, partial [Propionibacteriaceae bacterium]|nr:hypothetical protein [Propionibacteriaceae bacterium]